MLQDYIQEYKRAMEFNDKITMKKIERDFALLGMDKHTLLTLAKDNRISQI